jgi:hypothetical protein
MTRTARRIVTATAAIALVIAPATGIASAHDRGNNGHGGGAGLGRLDDSLSSNTALVSAIRAARDAYRASVQKAGADLRTTLGPVRTAIDAATVTQRAAVKTAADQLRAAKQAGTDTTSAKAALDSAWSAYKAALASAKAGRQSTIDAALATYKNALAAARTTYQAAINAAFAANAPGTTPPAWLLEPAPGKKGHGMENWATGGMNRPDDKGMHGRHLGMHGHR